LFFVFKKTKIIFLRFGAKTMATLMEFAAMQLERDGYSSRADILGPEDFISTRPPYLHVKFPPPISSLHSQNNFKHQNEFLPTPPNGLHTFPSFIHFIIFNLFGI
jgi:hypothetical protein